MKETVSIETFTPEHAHTVMVEQEKLIADGAYKQRPLSEQTVNKYANDMKRGNWRTNGQGIEFDENGFLRNGRTRLWAVVRAGVPVAFTVYRGPSSVKNNGSEVSLSDSIDIGRSRSVGQQLSIDGLSNGQMVAAAIRAIAIIATRSRNTRVGIMPSREIYEIYGPQINKTFSALHSNPVRSRGFIIGPLAIYRSFAADKADDFADSYIRLENLDYKHPAMSLRRFFENNKGGGSDSVVRNVHATCLALYHFHKDSPVSTLRFSAIGVDWIHSEQGKKLQKIREIVGAEDLEPEAQS